MSSDREQAEAWARSYLDPLVQRAERYVAELNERPQGQEALGEPTVGLYTAFDIAALAPIQFIGSPPYAPSKIVKAGEPAFIACFMFVNPAADVDQGFAVPPGVQLGGRRWRVQLQQINLSDLAAVPAQTQTGVFTSPAPMFTTVVFPIPALDPGEEPRLMEANITADIVDPAQPYAAFATVLPNADPYAWAPFFGDMSLAWLGRLGSSPIRYMISPA
jgi:hypothetical protein